MSLHTDILPRKQEAALEHNMKNLFVTLPQEILDIIDDPENLSIGERLALRLISRVLFIRRGVCLPLVRDTNFGGYKTFELLPSEMKGVDLALNYDREGNIRSLDCRGVFQKQGMAYCGECKCLHPIQLFTEQQLLLAPAERRCRRLRLCPHREISHLEFLELQNPHYGMITSTWCTAHLDYDGKSTSGDIEENTSARVLRGVEGPPPFHPVIPSYQHFECMRFDTPTVHSFRAARYMPASTCSLWRRHSLFLTNVEELQQSESQPMAEAIATSLESFVQESYVCEHITEWPKIQYTACARDILDGAVAIISKGKEKLQTCADKKICTAPCVSRHSNSRLVKEPVEWVRLEYNRFHVEDAQCRCALEFTLRQLGTKIELFAVMTRLLILPEKIGDNFWVTEVNRRR
jgi:hypothetical protein